MTFSVIGIWLWHRQWKIYHWPFSPRFLVVSCNRGKWHYWPSEELLSKGYRFIDTCKETFSEHFVDEDGYWKPISNAGEYTAERIRLNSPHNIEVRQLVKRYHNQLSDSVLDWDKPIKDQLIPLINVLLEK